MSSGLRPAASRPSIDQLVIEALELEPGLLPQPPSLFWTETSQSAAPVAPVAPFACDGIALTSSSAASTVPASAGVRARHSNRSRNRASIRSIAGPAISAKTMLPIAWARSNGIARDSSAAKRCTESSPP